MARDSFPRPTTASTSVVVAFELTDSAETFHVAAREGVVTVYPGGSDDAAATVRLPQLVWMSLVLGLTSLADALLADGVEAAGDLATFVHFHRRFTTTNARPQPSRWSGQAISQEEES